MNLLEDKPRARTPEIEQELNVAIFDLVEDNRFQVSPREEQSPPPGPYKLGIGMAERMLQIDVRTEAGEQALELHLSLSPLRGIIKDYFAICEQYFDAVKKLPPSKIEAIDMGRRGLHNEGAEILSERLDGKIATDQETARRLFTVVCALQFRG
ncbi:MAG: UPF0262 family protein [Pseudomonadota bacterium]